MSFNPDLTLNAVVVNLIATTDGYMPLTQGALAHAAFLDLVAAAAPDLAARLHDSGVRQPFTISPLRELPEQTDADGYRLHAGARAALRLTLLDPDLFGAFLQRLLTAGPNLRLLAFRRQVLVDLVQHFVKEGAGLVGDDPLFEAFQGAVIRPSLERAIADKPLAG